MKQILTIITVFICSYLSAQTNDIYKLHVKNLIVHDGPSEESKTIGELKRGDAIVILAEERDNWYQIQFGKKKGYILGPSLDQEEFWTLQVTANKGPTKAVCEDFENLYDPKLNNYLQINTGDGRDVVIKLMQKNASGSKCIRSIYIDANSETKIRNIPEGKYYVKVAYGNRWSLDISNNICYGKFNDNAIYEKSEEIYDFHITKTANGFQVPSYQLTLEIISDNKEGESTLDNQISEEDFNN